MQNTCVTCIVCMSIYFKLDNHILTHSHTMIYIFYFYFFNFSFKCILFFAYNIYIVYTVIVVSISYFICVRFSDSTFSDLFLLYVTHYRRYIHVYFYFICIVCIIFNSYALCNPYNDYVYIYIYIHMHI